MAGPDAIAAGADIVLVAGVEVQQQFPLEKVGFSCTSFYTILVSAVLMTLHSQHFSDVAQKRIVRLLV